MDLFLVVSFAVFSAFLVFSEIPHLKNSYKSLSPTIVPTQTPIPTPTPTPVKPLLSPPLSDDFLSKATKKTFGLYVDPKHSPISPERFTGFHTGTDFEYSDTTSDVSVLAVAPGKIIYSGWVSGYGGLIAESVSLNSNDYIVIYGHLRPSSLLPANSTIQTGDKIAVLGTAYSHETDGERRHLHLAIVKGTQINFLGYVKNESDLSAWVDPLSLLR